MYVIDFSSFDYFSGIGRGTYNGVSVKVHKTCAVLPYILFDVTNNRHIYEGEYTTVFSR